MTKVNGNAAKWASLVFAFTITAGGWIYSMGVQGQSVKMNTADLAKLKIEVEALKLFNIRVDERLTNIDEKMGTILVQMNSLQAMMQTTAIQQETMKVKVEMIQDDISAVKTQVAEALRTR